MIRISTTKVQVGDLIRGFDWEGTVTSVPRHFFTRFSVEVDGKRRFMTDAGTVELLSDLNGRTPAQSFGRW